MKLLMALTSLFISGHAIDRASRRCGVQWKKTRKRGEGLHTWLKRLTLLAMREKPYQDQGTTKVYHFRELRFVVDYDEHGTVLVTIMPISGSFSEIELVEE